MAAYYESAEYKELTEDKEEKFLVKFLRACNNFNTNRENAILLMYGFINDLGSKDINKKIYKNFTLPIIKKLISFCNISNAPNTDKWSSDFNASTNGHAILSNQQKNMELFDDARCLKVVKYGYGECYGISRIYENHIRKLWKIQIKTSINDDNDNMSHNKKNKDKQQKQQQKQQITKEESLQFAIGIDNYTNRYHLHLTNLNLIENDKDETKENQEKEEVKDQKDKSQFKGKKPPKKGGKVNKTSNTHKNKAKSNIAKNELVVRNNDIISVLFYQSDTDKNILKFALNGKQIGKEYKDLRVSSSTGRGGRIVVTFYQTMQFIMLKEDKDE